MLEPTRAVRFRERPLEVRNRAFHELAANVVVADRCTDRVAGNRHPFDERMWVVEQDLAIMARTGLTLVGVADQVLLHRRFARHERELEPRRETGAAAAAQSRGFDLLDDRLALPLAFQHLVPGFVTAELEIILERPWVGGELPRRKAD